MTSTGAPVTGWVEGESRCVKELPLEAEIARGCRRDGSPETGRSIAARCTRIWSVRPVSSRMRRNVAGRRRLVELEVGHGDTRRGRVERVPKPVVTGRVRSGASIVPAAANEVSPRRARGIHASAPGAGPAAATARRSGATGRRRATRTWPGRGGERCPVDPPPHPRLLRPRERERACRPRARARDGQRRLPACPPRASARPRRPQ